jgi:hypothetical protein
MTMQCCVCKKVKDENSWKNSQNERPAEISHTYCPTCLHMSRVSMAEERRLADLGQPASA